MAAEQGRSLAGTPTWSMAIVTMPMVAACFLVERSLSRFAKWLRKTKRKAMLAALEKIREELMLLAVISLLLGVISLLLSQTARFISEICVPSSLFTSRLYICSENEYEDLLRNTDANQTTLHKSMFGGQQLTATCLHSTERAVNLLFGTKASSNCTGFSSSLVSLMCCTVFVTVVLSVIKLEEMGNLSRSDCYLGIES